MAYEISQKRVLVTKATGLIGSRMVLRLLQDGASVRAFVRSSEKAGELSRNGAEIYPGDMTDHTSLQQAVKGCQVVFHFAGLQNEPIPALDYFHVNVEGTRVLAESALDVGVERFFHTSTVYVYGMGTTGLVNEESPHFPSSDSYADTKRAAEDIICQMVAARGFPAVIIQPSQVYGPEDMTWTLHPLDLIRKRRMFLVDGGKGLVQPIFIDDLLEGIMAVTRHGQVGEAYILCGSRAVNLAEFFRHYARILHRRRPLSISSHLAMIFASVIEKAAGILGRTPDFTPQEVRNKRLHITFDGTKAERDLGFVPWTSLDEGMGLLEKWLQRIE